MVAGLYLLKRDILFRSIRIPTARATAAATARAATLVPRRWQICRHNMILLVLLFPRAGFCAVGDLLCAISFQLARILLHAGEFTAVGNIVLGRPVLNLFLNRRLAVRVVR